MKNTYKDKISAAFKIFFKIMETMSFCLVETNFLKEKLKGKPS